MQRARHRRRPEPSEKKEVDDASIHHSPVKKHKPLDEEQTNKLVSIQIAPDCELDSCKKDKDHKHHKDYKDYKDCGCTTIVNVNTAADQKQDEMGDLREQIREANSKYHELLRSPCTQNIPNELRKIPHNLTKVHDREHMEDMLSWLEKTIQQLQEIQNNCKNMQQNQVLGFSGSNFGGQKIFGGVWGGIPTKQPTEDDDKKHKGEDDPRVLATLPRDDLTEEQIKIRDEYLEKMQEEREERSAEQAAKEAAKIATLASRVKEIRTWLSVFTGQEWPELGFGNPSNIKEYPEVLQKGLEDIEFVDMILEYMHSEGHKMQQMGSHEYNRDVITEILRRAGQWWQNPDHTNLIENPMSAYEHSKFASRNIKNNRKVRMFSGGLGF